MSVYIFIYRLHKKPTSNKTKVKTARKAKKRAAAQQQQQLFIINRSVLYEK